MRFDIITIFPEIFNSFQSEALIARAQKKKIISINPHNLRKWTADAHQSVDDRPYGGGAGMVMMVEPILKAVMVLRKSPPPSIPPTRGGKGKNKRFLPPRWGRQGEGARVILFSAKGKKFNQSMARTWAKKYGQLILICGRYEGIDERVAEYIADEEVSIGDYVLFGGEVPAMVVMEAVTRLLPGAIGKQQSLADESFNGTSGIIKQQKSGLVEYPHYTRPEVIKIEGKARSVPKVLLTGNHKLIQDWRREQSVRMTKKLRPDLLLSKSLRPRAKSRGKQSQEK